MLNGIVNEIDHDNVNSSCDEGQVSMHAWLEDQIAYFKQEYKSATWNRLARLAFILMFLVFIIIVIDKFEYSELQALIDQHQNLTLIISLSAIFITGLTLIIPTAPVTLLISVLIGPLFAIVITTVGNMLTAIVHYQLGKQIGGIVNFEEKKASLPFKLGKLPINSPLLMLIGRGLPGGPKGFSLICGAYGVPLFLYLWTTFVTEVIGSILIAYGGQLVKHI